MKLAKFLSTAAIFSAALGAPAPADIKGTGNVETRRGGKGEISGGSGGIPGLSNVLGLFSGEEGFFAFRKAFDILSEKACDFALNEASRFADFWVLVPAQSAQELVTGWFEIAESQGWKGIPETDFLEAQKHAKLLDTMLSEHEKGTFEGVQPNEFFASNTYLRCRQLYSTNPTDFIVTSPEKPKGGKPVKDDLPPAIKST